MSSRETWRTDPIPKFKLYMRYHDKQKPASLTLTVLSMEDDSIRHFGNGPAPHIISVIGNVWSESVK
jgi:hypothetical protein